LRRRDERDTRGALCPHCAVARGAGSTSTATAGEEEDTEGVGVGERVASPVLGTGTQDGELEREDTLELGVCIKCVE